MTNDERDRAAIEYAAKKLQSTLLDFPQTFRKHDLELFAREDFQAGIAYERQRANGESECAHGLHKKDCGSCSDEQRAVKVFCPYCPPNKEANFKSVEDGYRLFDCGEHVFRYDYTGEKDSQAASVEYDDKPCPNCGDYFHSNDELVAQLEAMRETCRILEDARETALAKVAELEDHISLHKSMADERLVEIGELAAKVVKMRQMLLHILSQPFKGDYDIQASYIQEGLGELGELKK